ncbi:MAG: hypothetical protein R3Y22_00025 [Bacteroidales bacterium]
MNPAIEKYKFYYYIFITCLTIQCYWGFMQEEILPFIESIKSYLFLLSDMGFLMLGVATLRKRSDKIMIISFVLLMIASKYINNIPISSSINGSRDFWSLIFIVPFIRYYLVDEERRNFFISKLDKFILIFLIVQIPVATYQCLLYGPHDRVGGTMGDGYSGILSTLLYLLTFYLLQKKIAGRNTLIALSENWYYFLFLIPSMLNETKASFIFLILMIISFLKMDRRIVLRVVIATPIIILIVLPIITTVYFSVTNTTDNIFSLEYYTEMYLLNDESVAWALSDDVDAEGQDIPRFTKVVAGWEILDEDNAFLLGKGVGLFKGKTMGIVPQIPFAVEYEWLLRGSVIMFFALIMQLGFLGIAWYIAHFIVNSPNMRKFEDININLYFFLFAVFLFLMVYNNSLFLPCFAVFFLYLLLISNYPVTKTE